MEFGNLVSLCILQNLEIRTGFLKDGKPIHFQKCQEITVSTYYSIEGDENMISMSYKKLTENLKPDSVILCSDGTITLKMLSYDKEAGLVRCRYENLAILGEKKNVNLPRVIIDFPTLTKKDKEDILQRSIPDKIHMIDLSFVRKGSDLVEVKKLLEEHAKSIMLMVKFKNLEGVANFDDILANSDAFMVARGDLGMEIPIEKIFYAQKVKIFKCNMQGNLRSFGASTRVGNELGADRLANAQRAMIMSLACAVMIRLMAMVFTTSIRYRWGRLFTNNEENLEHMVVPLPISKLCELGNCPRMTGCGVLRGERGPTLGLTSTRVLSTWSGCRSPS